MDTSANITTMGIIANEVYDNLNVYFTNKEKYITGTTYKVIDHTPTGNEGFNALLLKDESTGEYVIAFRGTQEKYDIVEDAIIGLNNYSTQFEQAKVWVNQMIENNNIDKTKLTLTGHSLGGILTQAIGATYQISGYAFNAYGVERLLTMPSLSINPSLSLELIGGILNVAIYKIFDAFGLEAPNAEWAQENILNVQYFDNGIINGDPLSNLVTYYTSEHLGSFLPIFGPEANTVDGHKMPTLLNAISNYNNILNSFNSETSFHDLTNIYTSLGFDKINNIFNELNIINYQNLSINFLNTKTQAALKNTSVANLYALENLNPFSIEGDLAAYQNIDTLKYTEKYLEDRSQYLYYLLDKENRYNIDASLTMTMYQDLNLGHEYTLSQSFSKSKIIFGGDNFDYIQGSKTGDRLYGNNGDMLFGFEGDDTLVSNYDSKMLKGETNLQGGSGSDIYIIAENTINNINDSNIDNNKIKLNFELKSINVVIINNTKYITLNDNTFILMNNNAISEMEFQDGYVLTNADLKAIETNKTKEEKENILQYIIDNFKEQTLTESLFGGNVNYQSRNNFLTNLGYVSTYLKFDPLVIDLNNDNQIDLISENNSNIYFDMNNDNIKEKTSWLSANEGFIVIDKNENNTIDNLNELMGELNLSGLEELKTYDLNGDNLINAEDEIFSKIKIWQDLNSDAISQSNELYSLESLNIIEIDLNSTKVSIILDGGEITELSTVSLQNNETMLSADINLNVSNVYKEYSYENINTFDISTLFYLNMKGYGTIKDSLFIYNENQSFKNLIASFETKNRIDNIDIIKFLTKWTNSESLTNREYISGELSINEKIWILESFTNQNVFKTQIENYYKYNYQLNTSLFDIHAINKAFYALTDRYLNLFNVSKYIKENNLHDKIYYSTECDNFLINDISYVNSYIENNFNIQSMDFLNFIHMIQDSISIESFSIENLGYDNYKLMEKMLDNSYMNIKIVSNYELTYNKTILIDNQLNNNIFLTNQDAFIFNMEGNDIIMGSAKTYIYLIKNHGNDMILNYKNGDNIEFSKDINKNDIRIQKIDNDLKIHTSENNSILLKNWFIISFNDVNKFIFSDGTSYNNTNILTALSLYTSTTGDDNIITYNGNDIINGLGGNDTITDYGGFNEINTGDGNDIIKLYNSTGNIVNSGAGNDNIYITSGDNTIYAGAGNDIIQGNAGNDIIYAGAGNDYILTGAGNNIVYLEEGDNKVYITSSNFYDKNKIFLGTGNDTVTGNDYLIDTIIVSNNSGENLLKTLNKNDIIEFDSTVNKDKIRIENVSTGVKIYTDNRLDNYILIEYWNVGSSNALNTFKFADNSVLNKTNINSLMKIISGTDNNDIINSTASNLIYSKNGNDIINNISGNNEYLFNIGNGIDTINDTLNTGKILFSNDIYKENVSIFKDENNAYHIDYSNQDKIIFNGVISNIELSDSTFISSNDINRIIQDMNAFAAENDFSINSIDDIKNNQNLMQIISSSFHS